MSLLFALSRTRTPGGGVNSLIGVRNGASRTRIVGGSQLMRRTRGHARAEPVRLNARAAHHAGPDGVTVDADDLVAPRRAIVSVPPVLAVRIARTTAAPDRAAISCCRTCRRAQSSRST